jgi:hypothetical protein
MHWATTMQEEAGIDAALDVLKQAEKVVRERE